MKPNNKKKLVIAICLIAISLVAFRCLRNKTEVKPLIETAVCKKGKIVNVITATGTLKPIVQVEVGTQVSGTIKKIYVDYNSRVKKGELLAEIDRTVLESSLLSAETGLASDKANLDYQEKNYNRIKALYDKKAISDADYESAEYDYKRIKYAYEKSLSALTTAKTNLGYSRIYSPIDGVILSRAVDEGQTVAASFSTPTLFTIANDLTKMQVIANVDEADIGQVKKGQKVSFTVDAFPEDNFSGTVTQVRLEATTTSNVVTYSVVIDAPNPDLKLMPGLTANITVYTLEKDNILLIPTKATRFQPDETMIKMLPKPSHKPSNKDIATQELKNNEKRVWIKNGENIYPTIIEIGENDATHYEVIKGLKEGEKVILSISKSTAAETSTENTGTEKSPFMPTRPTKNAGPPAQ